MSRRTQKHPMYRRRGRQLPKHLMPAHMRIAAEQAEKREQRRAEDPRKSWRSQELTTEQRKHRQEAVAAQGKSNQPIQESGGRKSVGEGVKEWGEVGEEVGRHAEGLVKANEECVKGEQQEEANRKLNVASKDNKTSVEELPEAADEQAEQRKEKKEEIGEQENWETKRDKAEDRQRHDMGVEEKAARQKEVGDSQRASQETGRPALSRFRRAEVRRRPGMNQHSKRQHPTVEDRKAPVAKKSLLGTVRLFLHKKSFHAENVVINPKRFPGVKVGDILALVPVLSEKQLRQKRRQQDQRETSMEKSQNMQSPQRLNTRVTSISPVKGRFDISVESSLAEVFGLTARMDTEVRYA